MAVILADSNVWIEHLQGKTHTCPLEQLLKNEKVILHDWILGELLLGQLGPKRQEIAAFLRTLPRAEEHPLDEVLDFIECEHLFGRGLSLIDAQLLYGAVKDNYELWTFDKALRNAAARFDRAYSP